MEAIENAGAHIPALVIPSITGAILLILAILDPGRSISKLYENHEGWWISFWGLSWSAKSFRVVIAVFGLLLITAGVLTMFLAAGYSPTQ